MLDPATTIPRWRALAGALVLAACGGSTTPDVTPPASRAGDLAASEEAARRIEQDVAALVLEPLARRELDAAERGLVRKGFAAELPGLGDPSEAGELRVTHVVPTGRTTASRGEFLRALHDLNATTGDPARIECELERVEVDEAGSVATGRMRLRWAGVVAEAGPLASRGDLTLYADVRMRREDGGDWRLAAFVPAGGETRRPHALGAGIRIAGGPARFQDRTREVGLTFGTSSINQELLQTFIDRHRTLTLGGLSVCDYDGDGRPDLIATRSEEASLVFLNDGVSGFVPHTLPMERQSDCPAFVLFVDLDGDGREELVASEASRYEGEFAYAGLWTRTGAEDGAWRHLPRAFAMPNPVGRRRLAVQTVAPLDIDGDGDLDLFFAVYGDALSRGEHYNTVEAYDGADNHLFVNVGGLEFVEESEARGITGTGYTYVALAFDADHDGDPDLFEGNDFGPNVLWRNDGGDFVADDRMGFDGVSAYTMGAALADLEADGTWDLYVSNMSSEEGMRMIPHAPDVSEAMRGRVDVIARGNMLYRESGAGAAWSEVAEAWGVHEGEWAWGCQFLDVDGDGALEIGVTNGFASHRDPTLGDWQTYYWRQVLDDAVRLERGERTRDVNSELRFRGSFNGHERDRLYVRTSGADVDRPWVDAAWMHGLDQAHDGRAVVPIDVDGDGDLDLALWTLTGLVFYENTGPATDWCRLRLVDEAGAPALGARVRVTARGRTVARHVALVEGFQSQVSSDVHVGLGAPMGAPVDRIEVTWADGTVDVVEGAASSRLLVIAPVRGLVETREVPRWEPLEPLTEAAASRLHQLARSSSTLGQRADFAVVVHVSAAGKPDRQGLDAMARIHGFGRVVVASLRGAKEPPSPGVVLPHEISLEPELFAQIIGSSDETTVVFDDDGQVVRVVRGPLDAGAVITFARLVQDERPLPHLLIEHGRLALDEARYRDALSLFTQATRDRDDLSVRDAAAFEGLGRAHVLLGRVDRAEAAYRRAIDVDPDYALGHYNLGVTLNHLERYDEAIASLSEARRIEGDSPRVLGALLDAAALKGDAALAREVGDTLLTVAGESAMTRVVLGKVEARAERYDAALEHFEKALEVRPGDGEALAGRRKVRELLSGEGRGSED